MSAIRLGERNTESESVHSMTIRSITKNVSKRSSSQDQGSSMEKGETLPAAEQEIDCLDAFSHEYPFPETSGAPLETQQFTARAVLVGCILGGVISASNIYLGLKTGWTFGASLFGSIFGFAILKPLSKTLPERFGGGYFGPKENVCCQSAATAAGSLGLIFTSGVPAAYQLGLLGASPKEDFGRLVTFTLAAAYFGMFFAIPLRRFYILKQKLVFPSAVAAAHTIRSLHTGKHAEVNAKKKTRALVIAFCCAITLRVVSEYAPGILWDWHWGWTLYSIGWHNAIFVENWNWIFEFTPAFIGAGMLTGINASYSFFGGAILAWGIIAPALVTTGKAFGDAVSPQYPGYVNYMNLVLDDPANEPSPRYWLIWPGTMLLLCGSFAEVASNYKTLFAYTQQFTAPLIRYVRHKDVNVNEEDLIEDPAPPEEQVPVWMWSGGVLSAIFLSCLVLGVQYQQNVGLTLLAIVLAFIFSFIGAESAGRTNITPVTTIGNASQLVIGGATKAHYPAKESQLLNTTGGLLALAASEQSADMLGDLKTTHLLRASPRVQFYAQCCGAVVSIFMSVGIYVLFSAAYPCINDLALQDHCAFAVPDVGAWRAIAIAVSSPSLPIPPSSGYTSIGLGLCAIVLTTVKYRFVRPEKHHWVPNPNAIGIAFILNTTTYPAAMATGATFVYFWRKKYPASCAMYCYAIAAGFIAGEGLGGIVGAILQIAGVSGASKGTAIGCPAMEYCG